jgi:hypothetical protein
MGTLGLLQLKELFDTKENLLPILPVSKFGTIGNALRILEDSKRNIWFGSVEGVYRYDGNTITDFKSKQSQSICIVND